MNNKVKLQSEEIEEVFKNHLKIESKVMSIETLLGNVRMRRKIIYNPYYQRNYVWDSEKATYFIESILLGTEIPPLVFFKTDDGKIEVIDGRQRYETLDRFLEGNLSLSKQGLQILKSLHKYKYPDLDEKIQELYLDTKIRIIEFSIVNEPKLTDRQEDLIKKEIFRRYNSGITPLKNTDIYRATYHNDDITNLFKSNISKNENIYNYIIDTLFYQNSKTNRKISVDAIMEKVRQILVINKVPVKYYSRSGNRKLVVEKLYEILMNEIEDIDDVYNKFISKIELLKDIKLLFETKQYECNRLVYEGILWMLYICENEKIQLPKFNEQITFYEDLVEYIHLGIDKFNLIESHFYKRYEPRYEYLLGFIEEKYNVGLFNIYVLSNGTRIDSPEQEEYEIKDKLDELKNIRIDKAEPSSTTIEDLNSQMLRKKFLIRPTYQRDEVINLTKASSIIESILLDIKLPPIFIYKRNDGVSEVVDGQQRLLTILGYIGSSFCNEQGDKIYSKKNNFRLKDLKILEELNGRKFNELDDKLQDRIFDFNLSIVRIDEDRNLNFNPIDLFIRLNNKPYPIRENTFEMWNSYIDKDIITSVKSRLSKNEDWFYFRKNNKRMVNEELYTILAYICYKNKYEHLEDKKIPDMYQKGERINFRIQDKKNITKILTYASEEINYKRKFLDSIKEVESFIKNLRLILVDKDITVDNTNSYLRKELNTIFGLRDNAPRRSLQDFYALWYILNTLNYHMILKYREEIKEELAMIFMYMKNVPQDSFDDFNMRVDKFKEKYKVDNRSIKLTDEETMKLLEEQNNICPICKNKIFFTDITHNDHAISLAKGGSDSKENIQVVHERCNLEKGAK
ncbi:GmrSD restriction endonuclease domain-containing protein [Clostridioides difficile]